MLCMISLLIDFSCSHCKFTTVDLQYKIVMLSNKLLKLINTIFLFYQQNINYAAKAVSFTDITKLEFQLRKKGVPIFRMCTAIQREQANCSKRVQHQPLKMRKRDLSRSHSSDP